jgi:hypothetical protein
MSSGLTFRSRGGESCSRDHSPPASPTLDSMALASSSRTSGAAGRLARSMYLSPTVRLREGLPHRARGGHDRLTSTILPAGCTIKPPDAGSRQCPWVTALLTERLASNTPSGSWPKLTPIGQHAWRDTNRSSGACSNACGRTDSNRSATPSPSLLIRRLCHAHPLPAYSLLACQNATHWCAVGGDVERPFAARNRPG